MDYNADGVIDTKDSVPVKNLNYPLTTYGLTIGFSWKGLALNALFYAATGVYKADINDFLFDFPRGNVKAQPNTLDRRTVEDAGATEVVRPAVHLDNTYNSKASTYNYTDYSYLRLKNLEIGYTIKDFARIYCSGTNLFIISPFKYWDAEKGSGNGLSYPLQRTVQLGLQFNF